MVNVRANADYGLLLLLGQKSTIENSFAQRNIRGKNAASGLRPRQMMRSSMHQKMAHGVKEISPDLEKRIKAAIKTVSTDVPEKKK